MNGGGSSRVSIPSSERKIIQDIKEIARNHSDEEIYAMLKECSMDPNDTVQKLLYQDTFHEVKRKRDRRKEHNLVNKESHDTSWRPSVQGRGNRGGRGGYHSKYQSRGANHAKEDEPIQTAEKSNSASVAPQVFNESEASASHMSVTKESQNELKPVALQAPHDATSLEEDHPHVKKSIISDDIEKSDSGMNETITEHSINRTSSQELVKISTKTLAQELNFLSPSSSKPPSNSGNRLQQVIGPQKVVGPNMEWKPKSTNPIPVQASDASHATIEKEEPIVSKEKSTANLQKKLEELHFSESQHVIIPDHLQVPESQRSGLSFGSFDSGFGFGKWSALPNGSVSDKNSTPMTESLQRLEEDGSNLRSQDASPSVQEENPNEEAKEVETLQANESNAPLEDSVTSEQEELRGTTALSNESSQVSALLAPPLYSAFGLIPPVLGGQFAPFEVSDAQTRDSSAVASFIPFDPSGNYYTQIYQPGAERDGRFPPYLAPVETKYNGSTASLPSQSSQPSPEPASSPALPTTGITVLTTTTQPSGAQPVSISPQPLSPYRQPVGVHMPQYPPNYMPYAHYFSPFYVPTPIHPFFSNPSFAQQPLPGTLYAPATTSAAPAAAKNSQFKSSAGGGYPSLSSNGPYNSGQPSYNDDPASAHYKEANVYISGQQSEGSGGVWIPNSGRDVSGSFYNLSTGQPVNAFGGLYHPSQSLGGAPVHPMIQPPMSGGSGGEMGAAPAGVYQQPQRSQMNWAGNY